MPTSKKRLNITVSDETALFLKKMALKDNMSQSAKALQLIELALEEEEGFKPTFVKEVKRRSEEDALIPADEVIRELW